MTDQRRMKIVETTLAAELADDVTLTLAYPTGTNQAYFTGGNANATGQLSINNNDVYEEADADTFSLTYGASNITFTNLLGVAIASGSDLRIGLAYADEVYSFGGQKSGAIASLTDSSGGTASATLAAISGTYDQAEVRNSIASLAAKIEAITVALEAAGIIES